MLFINARGYSNISNDSRLRIFQVYAPRNTTQRCARRGFTYMAKYRSYAHDKCVNQIVAKAGINMPIFASLSKIHQQHIYRVYNKNYTQFLTEFKILWFNLFCVPCELNSYQNIENLHTTLTRHFLSCLFVSACVYYCIPRTSSSSFSRGRILINALCSKGVCLLAFRKTLGESKPGNALSLRATQPLTFA